MSLWHQCISQKSENLSQFKFWITKSFTFLLLMSMWILNTDSHCDMVPIHCDQIFEYSFLGTCDYVEIFIQFRSHLHQQIDLIPQLLLTRVLTSLVIIALIPRNYLVRLSSYFTSYYRMMSTSLIVSLALSSFLAHLMLLTSYNRMKFGYLLVSYFIWPILLSSIS